MHLLVSPRDPFRGILTQLWELLACVALCMCTLRRWLPERLWINFKILILVCKAHMGKAPQYIIDGQIQLWQQAVVYHIHCSEDSSDTAQANRLPACLKPPQKHLFLLRLLNHCMYSGPEQPRLIGKQYKYLGLISGTVHCPGFSNAGKTSTLLLNYRMVWHSSCWATHWQFH
jgi:hypothetical protein